MQFLFDLVNFIAGYTHKYYQEMQGQATHRDLVLKYREERERCEKAKDSAVAF